MGEIDVKAAVHAAIDYLKGLGELLPARGVRLEETEYDDSGFWLITLSTLDEAPELGSSLDLLIPPSRPAIHTQRRYRLFRIDARTGEVKSMKVRPLEMIE
ncbi:hypothetical protein GJ689_13885 [Rhodoplanes serenus]|uniref:Uncharacterized protein n=1 Tax=Rhodoplanes serenus TaxID=200615 RepID=A0A9X4XLG3_9BRAD|nr:hypothetical protein [Rhodoplanes serenus]MTW17293.1 hypothetical protein [Rhodoplanes serenus]